MRKQITLFALTMLLLQAPDTYGAKKQPLSGVRKMSILMATLGALMFVGFAGQAKHEESKTVAMRFRALQKLNALLAERKRLGDEQAKNGGAAERVEYQNEELDLLIAQTRAQVETIRERRSNQNVKSIALLTLGILSGLTALGCATIGREKAGTE